MGNNMVLMIKIIKTILEDLVWIFNMDTTLEWTAPTAAQMKEEDYDISSTVTVRATLLQIHN